MKKLLFLISLITMLIQANAEGAWPAPKKANHKFSQWRLVADRHHTPSQTDPNSTRSTFTTGFYGEYAITDRLTGSDEKIWFITKLNVVESLENDVSGADGGRSVLTKKPEYASYTLELACHFTEKFGLSTSYSNAFGEKIIFANPAYSMGNFLDIK